MVEKKNTKRKKGSTATATATSANRTHSAEEETDKDRDSGTPGGERASKESLTRNSNSRAARKGDKNGSNATGNVSKVGSNPTTSGSKSGSNPAMSVQRNSGGNGKTPKKGGSGSKEAIPAAATPTMGVLHHLSKIGWNGVEHEFTAVRSIIQREVFTYTNFTKNPVKNRFMDVVCLDNSRYILSTGVPPLSDYIHANVVKLKNTERSFIATQTPMESTTEDFWRLVYDTNPTLIICLQELEVISGRKGESSYFPLKQGESSVYGCMTVTNKHVITSEEVAKTTGFLCMQLELVPDDVPSPIQIKIIQTSEWPDSGVVSRERRIALAILKAVEAEPKGSHTIVHCAAGIGRTGTLILLSAFLAVLHKTKSVHLPTMLLELRGQRASSIQTLDQYAAVYALFLESLLLGGGDATQTAMATKLLSDYAAFRKARPEAE